MSDFFEEYRFYLVFFHILGAVVWVGGMISMRFAAHYAFVEIASPGERIEKTSIALKKLFMIVLPFVLLLAATGALLTVGYGIKHTDFHYLTHIKEVIWSIMFFNLLWMILRQNKAEKSLKNGDWATAGKMLGMIGKYMVPLNILLGIAAILNGVLLRIHL